MKLFKPSRFRTVDELMNHYGKELIRRAPRIKSGTDTAIYPGWTIRQMVNTFNGCLLINIDNQYRFLMPTTQRYHKFDSWPDYPSVKVTVFDDFWAL